MRTVTVIDNKVVVEVDGAKVRYSLEIIRKRINSLLQDLATWREYERLLTPRALDESGEAAMPKGDAMRHLSVDMVASVDPRSRQ